MISTIKEMECIKTFPKSEQIVSMINFQDRIFLATTKRVYELKRKMVVPLDLRGRIEVNPR